MNIVQVMESCFGRDYVKEQDAKIRSARETCNNQPSRAYLDEPKSEANFEYAQPQVEVSLSLAAVSPKSWGKSNSSWHNMRGVKEVAVANARLCCQYNA